MIVNTTSGTCVSFSYYCIVTPFRVLVRKYSSSSTNPGLLCEKNIMYDSDSRHATVQVSCVSWKHGSSGSSTHRFAWSQIESAAFSFDWNVCTGIFFCLYRHGLLVKTNLWCYSVLYIYVNTHIISQTDVVHSTQYIWIFFLTISTVHIKYTPWFISSSSFFKT